MGQRRAAVFCVALLLSACSKNESSTGASTLQPLAVTVSAARVKANGAATVNVSVSGATQGPILVSTSGGTFSNGTSSFSIDGTAGTATLTTCDARVDAGCVVGDVRISAQDARWSKGAATVRFYGFEAACGDGRDDNGDGAADCADPDCDQKACNADGVAGMCQGVTCVVPVCESAVPESGAAACSDGADNNCDGRVDCADTACDGAPCKPGSPSFACRTGQCVEQTSGFGLSILPSRTRLPADGIAVAPVAVNVTAGGAPAPGVAVTVSASAGAIALDAAVAELTTVEAVTDASGVATVYFKAPAAPVKAVLTAKITAKPEISHSAAIDMPRLGAMKLARVQYPVMGARSSGVNEQNLLTVVLLDTEQKPYPDGLAVTFRHQQLGGSEISKPWAMDTATCKGPGATPPGTCLSHVAAITSPAGEPDSTGEASVSLYPGTLAGSVTVAATATAAGRTISYTLPGVAITGARASGTRISVDCTPKNVPAFTDSDCRKTYYDGPGSTITCTAYLADRFDNVLGLPEHVSFLAENGASSPPAASVAYDPAAGGDAQRDLGKATGYVAVTGYDLPRDVEPIAEEVLTLDADLGCGFGVTTQNPRDGFVTVVAISRGEEGFVDGSHGMPADGEYQVGESFVDLGEPYVDSNDDSAFSADEKFLDLNGNGIWDGPNGAWDADTIVWAETRIVYTGFAKEGAPFSAWSPSSLTVDSSDGGKTATSEDASFSFSDARFNPPAPTQTTYAVASWAELVTAKIVEAPLAIDVLPAQFSQAYCDALDPSTRECRNYCAWAPCYAATNIAKFTGPTVGVARVTGGSKPGSDGVRATATLLGAKSILTGLSITAQ